MSSPEKFAHPPTIDATSPITSTSPRWSLPAFPNLPDLVPESFRDYIRQFSDWRDRLGLQNPGSIEGLHKEVQRDVFLTQYAFSGMKADLGRSFCANPLFQVQHSFSAGSSQVPPWSFLSMYATDNVFLQGQMDSDLQLMARCHLALNPQNVTKFMTQTSHSQPGGVFQLEHDVQLASTSLNFKTMNPDFTSQSFQGVFIASILQSITPRLSLGLESAWQRQPLPNGMASPGGLIPSETTTSFIAKLVGADKSWIAAATVVPTAGSLNATFWRRLGEKVEAGVQLELKAGMQQVVPQGSGLMSAGPMFSRVREGSATVGIKYEFRTAALRAQVDSGGRVSAFLERRVSPQIGLSFCGDIDHFKGVAKVGLGVSIEASDLPDEYPNAPNYIEQPQGVI